MQRKTMVLIGCVATGLLLIANGAFVPLSRGMQNPENVVATVNGHAITWTQFRSAASVAQVTGADQRAELLQYLIDESLLVQHGVELGLLESHPRLRKLVVRREIDFISTGASQAAPGDDVLQHFYASRRALFQQPRALMVDGLSTDGACSSKPLRPHIIMARGALLSGADIASASRRSGMRTVSSLAMQYLSPAALADRLGTPLTEELLKLTTVNVTRPLSSGDSCYVLRILGSQPAVAPRFEDVRDKVLSLYQSVEAEAALDRLLIERRGVTAINLAPWLK